MFAVIVVSPKGLGYSKMFQQLAGNTRIFASHRIAAREYISGTNTDITEIPDRGGDKVKTRCKAGDRRRGVFAHLSPMNHC